MANKAVLDAVMARLGATWSGVPVVQPFATNERPAAPYIVVEFPVANVERVSIGSRVYREDGGFRLVLALDQGVGLGDLLTKADALAAYFRDQAFGGVVTQVPSAPFLDDGAVTAEASIVVPYTYQFEG